MRSQHLRRVRGAAVLQTNMHVKKERKEAIQALVCPMSEPILVQFKTYQYGSEEKARRQ